MFEVEKLVGARSEWEWAGRESSGIKRDATRNPWLRRDVRSLWTFWGKFELMRRGANQGMIWATNRCSWPAIHFDFFRHFLGNILLQAISVIGADKKATTWAKTRASRSHECQVGLYNNTNFWWGCWKAVVNTSVYEDEWVVVGCVGLEGVSCVGGGERNIVDALGWASAGADPLLVNSCREGSSPRGLDVFLKCFWSFFFRRDSVLG